MTWYGSRGGIESRFLLQAAVLILILDRVSAMVAQADRCIEEVGAACRKEGIPEAIQRLGTLLGARAKACGRLLGSAD